MATGTREEIRIGQLAIRFLVEGKDSGGSVAIFELDVPAGAKVPIPHRHDAYEETIYGIEGIITFTLEGRAIEIGPGDALCIPRGAVHRFDNFHSATSKTLAIVAPASSAQTTSAKSPPSPKPPQHPSPQPHPTPPPWPKSCSATASPQPRKFGVETLGATTNLGGPIFGAVLSPLRWAIVRSTIPMIVARSNVSTRPKGWEGVSDAVEPGTSGEDAEGDGWVG
jgi:quercetin dioxygenase-like cupin family protein